ncbi:hypothetical protein NSIN_20449 [Nitrosotalea sinensis]|jgi:LPXTG-motif cell wall-anchored protein|uniref:LPXTG cell wall anchor domain-containing protein n=2 Tax=Nitrosotalea sinensis TaxID=1499975 RepID=A0A2H1EGS6_9ARCH|nr:hypothetical protein NSIN_20449 [Candidatus Nitrosotalea sinensis]
MPIFMAFDIDQTMLVYLGMITAGIFIFPISSDPPYYLVIGIALIVIGGFLVYRKSRKTQ